MRNPILAGILCGAAVTRHFNAAAAEQYCISRPLALRCDDPSNPLPPWPEKGPQRQSPVGPVGAGTVTLSSGTVSGPIGPILR